MNTSKRIMAAIAVSLIALPAMAQDSGFLTDYSLLKEREGDAVVTCLCGAGNNGGDGLVAARQLHALGVPMRVLLVGERERLAGDAATNAARAEAFGIALEPPGELPTSGVLVDAVFGTGLVRDVTGREPRRLADWAREQLQAPR